MKFKNRCVQCLKENANAGPDNTRSANNTNYRYTPGASPVAYLLVRITHFGKWRYGNLVLVKNSLIILVKNSFIHIFLSVSVLWSDVQ